MSPEKVCTHPKNIRFIYTSTNEVNHSISLYICSSCGFRDYSKGLKVDFVGKVTPSFDCDKNKADLGLLSDTLHIIEKRLVLCKKITSKKLKRKRERNEMVFLRERERE